MQDTLDLIDHALFVARDTIKLCRWLRKLLPLLLELPGASPSEIEYWSRDWLQMFMADARDRAREWAQAGWTREQCTEEVRKLLDWK
jgi:hypothetical protein